jgi:hypothetical protein
LIIIFDCHWLFLYMITLAFISAAFFLYYFEPAILSCH